MIIYKINCNNKYYVGQTIQDFVERKRRHINSLNRQDHPNNYLQNAWNKYGEDSFEFEVVEGCESLEKLNEREGYWINELNSHHTKNGYNLMYGGNNKKHSEESKLKMSESHIGIFEGEDNPFFGKKHKNETRLKWSKKRKGKQKGVNNPFYGKTHTEETIKKINKTRKQRKINYKPVIQLSTDNEFIAEYESIKEAMNKTGINRTGISSVCRDIQKTAGGYKWSYK